MSRGNQIFEDALGEALRLYVNAARMIVLGTVLLRGGNKDDAVKIALREDTAKLVAKATKDLLDHVTNQFKTLKKGG